MVRTGVTGFFRMKVLTDVRTASICRVQIRIEQHGPEVGSICVLASKLVHVREFLGYRVARHYEHALGHSTAA